MNNITSVELSRNFYRRPKGGYPRPNPGAISSSGPKVIVRPKDNKTIRPALNQHKVN